jgi:DNA-binding transcriptional MerR regulator
MSAQSYSSAAQAAEFQDVNDRDADARDSAAEGKPSARSGKSATAFRTISEVADELDVQQHVLRFWETKFSQVRPLKRGGGRRYYRPEDVALLKSIHHLLYTEGYTIKGVQKLLKEQGKNAVIQNNKPSSGSSSAPAAQRPQPEQPAAVAASPVDEAAPSAPAVVVGLSDYNRSVLESMLAELKELRSIVAAAA